MLSSLCRIKRATLPVVVRGLAGVSRQGASRRAWEIPAVQSAARSVGAICAARRASPGTATRFKPGSFRLPALVRVNRQAARPVPVALASGVCGRVIDLTGSAQAALSGLNMAYRVTRGHGIDGRRDGRAYKNAPAAQAAQRSSPNVTSKAIVLPLRQT